MNLINLRLTPNSPQVHRRIMEALTAVFPKFRCLHNRDTHGGFFSFRDPDGTLKMFVGIGDVWEEKLPKYMEFSLEKSRRLLTYPEHLSSWQSRRPELNEYGGAIRTPHGLLSFSGLPEELDEALNLAISVRSQILLPHAAANIAGISGNKQYAEYCLRM